MKNLLVISWLLLLFLARISSGQEPGEFRIWTSRDGKQVKAAFVGLASGRVARFKAENGREYRTQINRFTAKDRDWLQQHRTIAVAQLRDADKQLAFNFDADDIRNAFKKMNMDAGFIQRTEVQNQVRARTVTKTSYQRQCVCVNGRWVWRVIPIQTQVQETYTVQVPSTVRVAAGLVDGDNWSRYDSRTGVGTATAIVTLTPDSVGARAIQVNRKSKGLAQLTAAFALEFTNDTKATLGATSWWNNATKGTEQAFQVTAVIDPVSFSTIGIQVLLRERDATSKVRSNDKVDLDNEATLLANAIKTALE